MNYWGPPFNFKHVILSVLTLMKGHRTILIWDGKMWRIPSEFIWIKKRFIFMILTGYVSIYHSNTLSILRWIDSDQRNSNMPRIPYCFLIRGEEKECIYFRKTRQKKKTGKTKRIPTQQKAYMYPVVDDYWLKWWSWVERRKRQVEGKYVSHAKRMSLSIMLLRTLYEIEPQRSFSDGYSVSSTE